MGSIMVSINYQSRNVLLLHRALLRLHRRSRRHRALVAALGGAERKRGQLLAELAHAVQLLGRRLCSGKAKMR